MRQTTVIAAILTVVYFLWTIGRFATADARAFWSAIREVGVVLVGTAVLAVFLMSWLLVRLIWLAFDLARKPRSPGTTERPGT